LPVQYVYYAHCQHQWLPNDSLECQFTFWKKKLEGMPQTLRFPFARTRPTIGGTQATTRVLSIPEELSEGVRELSRREGVTLFMTLLTAFKILLRYYTSEDDIVVGSPIANRTRREIEPLIGFFVNTLVLRSDLSGNPSFRELLSRVRETCLGAYANQDLPLEQLVQELRPERTSSRQPLFQTVFVLQNTPDSPLNVPVERQQLPGIGLSQFKSISTKAPFDLVFQVVDRSRSLNVTMWYDTDVFTSNRIRRIGEDYEALLHGIVYGADDCIKTSNEILIDFDRQRKIAEEVQLQETSQMQYRKIKRKSIEVISTE